MTHVHCSICGHAATFVVINRRKEREPLCESHMLWYLDNTEPRFMPDFDRIKACCGAVMREGLDKERLAANRRYCHTYYHKNRTVLLAQKREKREAFLNSVLLQ